jgi:thiol-disulfide isomerase/thioredoxin
MDVIRRTVALLALVALSSLPAQQTRPVWTALEQPIADQLRGLRKLPDDTRAQTTRDLALRIRRLPAGENKLRLAEGLAGLSTEGDFGHDTLQQVTDTLAEALQQNPPPAAKPGSSEPYLELAQLVRYEHVAAGSEDPRFAAAMSRLESDDRHRRSAGFTLTDLHGARWALKDLRGKVVLVNFWATWCPPCRREMPDLQALDQQFHDRGLVVLSITDEDREKVEPFIAERAITYPVLLDPGRKVNDDFRIEGIPKSFVYDRNGAIVAQAMDMRTRAQFLRMLAEAGLQ